MSTTNVTNAVMTCSDLSEKYTTLRTADSNK